MAIEYAILDLYHLFVEVIFGHFALAILGITAIFAIICGLFRMSISLIFLISTLFLFIMLTGYFGSIFAILMAFFAFTYFIYAIVRWIQGGIAT